MKKIKLPQGKYALVDDDWYEMLKHINWSAANGYAYAQSRLNGKGKNERMNRIIMDENNPEILIDHKDRNKLNNQKENLRRCNKSQNALNSPRYKGNLIGITVIARKNGKTAHHVRRKYMNKKYSLGTYYTLKEAIRVSNNFATKHFGEWANLIVEPD